MDLLLSTISSSDKNHINLIPFVRDLLNKMVEELRHQFLFMDQFPPHPNDFFLKPLLSRLKFSLSAILILMPSLKIPIQVQLPAQQVHWLVQFFVACVYVCDY